MSTDTDDATWSRLLNSPTEPKRYALDVLRKARFQHADLLSRLHDPECTILHDPEAKSAALTFSYAAARLLDIHNPPHFHPHPEGIESALHAAHIHSRLPASPFPYQQACLHVQTAALMAITQDHDLAKRWFHERAVASTIMAGHHADPALHAFYRLAHHTIHDLTGFGRPDIAPPSTIARQVENHLIADASQAADRMPHPRLYCLIGIHFWAQATQAQRRNPDLEYTNQALTNAALCTDEPQIKSTIEWVRAAYAHINLQQHAEKDLAT